MPNPFEIGELATQAVEAVATGGTDASRALFEGAFGGESVASTTASLLSHHAETVEALTGRLTQMPAQAPMAKMLDAAIATDDPGALATLRQFFALPTDARTLLTHGDIEHLTGLLEEGGPQSLGEFKSTLGTVNEIGVQAMPDATGSEILNRVRQSGVYGTSSWLDRLPHMGR